MPAPFNALNAEVSPDGRWLAYESNESGRNEIYVRPFPNVDAGKRQVSTNGGSEPLWARNGQELFYESMGALMRVPVKMASTFEAGTPRKLFDGPYLFHPPGGGLGRMYDVSVDGERFLMVKESSGADERPTVGSDHLGAKLVRGAEAPRAAEVTRGLRSISVIRPQTTRRPARIRVRRRPPAVRADQGFVTGSQCKESEE